MERLTIKAPSGLIHLGDSKPDTIARGIKKLSDYEDWEEQGLLLRLPCKAGDTVWQIHTLPRTNRKIIAEVEADAFFITLCVLEGRFGKTVFFTREEAEAALEKMKGEEHETD